MPRAGSSARTAGGGRVLGRVPDLACTALAAEQVGAAERCLELTVAYAKDRVQFGRPIGSFQAVKHRLADAYVLVESARSAALAAAFAAAEGSPETTRLAAVAKSACTEAFSAVASEMIQLHGGIGITWEHGARHYFKRAHGSGRLFGPPAWHRGRPAAERTRVINRLRRPLHELDPALAPPARSLTQPKQVLTVTDFEEFTGHWRPRSTEGPAR